MNIKNFTICLFYLGLNFNNSFAQSIKDEDVEYSYIQLPLNDIRTQVKNYSCKITPLYEEKNRKLMAEYEIEKQKAQMESTLHFEKEFLTTNKSINLFSKMPAVKTNKIQMLMLENGNTAKSFSIE